MNEITGIGRIGLEELPGLSRPDRSGEASFGDALKDAVRAVDELQHQSETAQATYVNGGEVDLHDVLIKIEEAELAFRTMMEVRNKLIDAYREVMRIA